MWCYTCNCNHEPGACRSDRYCRPEPLFTLPPLPTLPVTLPPRIDLGDYGTGRSASIVDPVHLGQWDRMNNTITPLGGGFPYQVRLGNVIDPMGQVIGQLGPMGGIQPIQGLEVRDYLTGQLG